MIHTAEDFLATYSWESKSTAGLLAALTDASLSQPKAPGHDVTAGSLAWHIATAPVYMLNQVGFNLNGEVEPPAALNVAAICARHEDVSSQVKQQVPGKSPEQLAQVYHVFGMFDWPASMMLTVLISHEIHHRGQLSVLMRQAGLVIPSLYGPTHEQTVELLKQKQAEQA